jgi:hypothetical protein
MASAMLVKNDDIISYRHCASYIHVIQQADWFGAAFPGHTAPVAVRGGQGLSHADASQRRIKIGTDSRHDVGTCEQACLHELAHIVSPDFGSGGERREPRLGRGSSKGHHHAWRVNFVLIVRQILGKQAALRLRYEFSQWGLATRR